MGFTSTSSYSDTNEMKDLWAVKSKNKLRKKFLKSHETFIVSTVSNALGKNAINTGSIEFGIGLNAFNFSIDAYHNNDYNGFLNYASEIITCWLKEYQVLDLKSFREEVVILKNKLWEFELTIKDLVALTPKQPEVIRQAVCDALFIISKETFFKTTNFKKRLAEEEVLELKKIVDKMGKKNQKYVLGIILVYLSDLTRLKSYLKDINDRNYVDNSIGTVIDFSKGKAVIMTEDARFIEAVSMCELYLGQQFYIPKVQNLKSGQRKMRFSLATAGALVILASLFYINPIGENGLSLGTNKVLLQTDGDTAQKEEEKSTPKDTSPQKSKGESDENIDNKKPEKVITEKKSSKPGTGGNVKTNQTQTNPKVSSIPMSTPRATDLKKGKPDTQSTGVNRAATSTPKVVVTDTAIDMPQPTKYIRPTAAPIPTDYKTVKADGVPGRIVIDSDAYEVRKGQEFTITMRIPKGNNATTWVLYENGDKIAEWHYPDNSPNEQAAMRIITPKQVGTFKYKCELSNAYGPNVSDEITVYVK